MTPSIGRRARLAYWRFFNSRSPQMNILLGFLIYAVLGWLLLCMPFLQEQPVGWLDNLFISTSAISTTGLVTVSVSDNYNLGGELVVLLLIQAGGIGYMTLTTYYLLFTTRAITRWHENIIGAAFTMPKNIEVRDFIKSAILFTLVMEILGTIGFLFTFLGTNMGLGEALWYSLFHSVSAFCTAGFGLFNDSFESLAGDGWVNAVISVLAICGSLGFIVVTDLYYRLSGREEHLSFTSRIIVFGFLILLTFGTTLIYFTEPLVHASGTDGLLKSFFASMTAMTTVGFNTVSTGAMRVPVLLVVTFLMYVGASPSGTAGGMKITTLTAMLAVLRSRLTGRKDITFLGRRIPWERLYVATSTFILYTSLIFIFSILLSYAQPEADYESVLFETASALGTVGLSMGLTGSLSAAGKAILIVVMFIGRVGVLTFGFALLEREQRGDGPEAIEDDLAV